LGQSLLGLPTKETSLASSFRAWYGDRMKNPVFMGKAFLTYPKINEFSRFHSEKLRFLMVA
jgi:hypothetical protein